MVYPVRENIRFHPLQDSSAAHQQSNNTPLGCTQGSAQKAYVRCLNWSSSVAEMAGEGSFMLNRQHYDPTPTITRGVRAPARTPLVPLSPVNLKYH